MALAGSAPGPGLREQVLLSQAELAHVAYLRGESSAARKLLEEGIPGAVALMNEAGGPGADVAVVLWGFRLVLWEVLYDLAESPAEYDMARDAAQAAVELARARAAARPDDALARYHLSIAYVGLGRSSMDLGDLDAADGYYRQALSESRALSERDPSNLRWLRGVGGAAEYMGGLIKRRDGVEAALPWYRESDAISARMVALSPANVGYQDDLARSAVDLAIALSDLKRYDECRAELQRALELLQRHGVDDNQPSRALHLRAEVLHMMGDVEIKAHRTAVGQVA